jgi:hypothetical protein
LVLPNNNDSDPRAEEVGALRTVKMRAIGAALPVTKNSAHIKSRLSGRSIAA